MSTSGNFSLSNLTIRPKVKQFSFGLGPGEQDYTVTDVRFPQIYDFRKLNTSFFDCGNYPIFCL
jgi:hypothetical protein